MRALSDRLRNSICLCGYTETLTFALVSAVENAAFLGRESPAAAAEALDPTQCQLRPAPVRLANAKAREFEQVRTTLIPGVLKSILHNKGRRELPIKCFEIGDVCVLDSSTATGARNLRHCCVAIADECFSGLEVFTWRRQQQEVHGVLDVVVQELRFTGDYKIAELEAGAAAVASAAAASASEEAGSTSESRAAGALALLKKVLDRSLGMFRLLPSKGKEASTT
ncbi:phenylalanine--tRNA ligase beta subunit-like, partial [Physeter macrocephalus]|uniref:Phenylalanine--tRNA ligase beta subunit-like n=1 Tax=Physeter macrocephalus TaxID=9755 RepID=A0A455B069_PHYMC